MINQPHIRLNALQQAVVPLGSAVGAFLDPRRADLIAALGETTGSLLLKGCKSLNYLEEF
ncbi:hypothetical protein DCAR_0830387 [Daucus carota subsp. sativus]|uniref:Uncharacterized protein n=1 Tax=Daucus carota subsp. sativus TaxID=79200 RepID=A0AAF1B977_DAUCS|nr:hypothetical protein DCAR_0830387 [Daucus carota subsp. sativus]